jgi:putative membrane protein
MHHVILAVALALQALPAAAHATAAAGRELADTALAVGFGAPLLAAAYLYAKGIAALWRSAGRGRGVRRAEAACFAFGWGTLAIALLPALDAATHRSFAVHMVQHELLMVVAAPLLVLGRPLEGWAWALPLAAKRSLRPMTRAKPLRQAWGAVTAPLGAWSFHALSVWVWHVPMLFRLALESVPLHILQHGCFFGSALALWWAAFGKASRAPTATSIASLFTTMLHTSALGALLTFAPTVWYATEQSPPFGLTPLEDQQLGGLVMWVPGGLGYMIAGLAIVARWLAPARGVSKTAGSETGVRETASRGGATGALDLARRDPGGVSPRGTALMP